MLPAPNLDDRRFQDLVDEAKRYVQQNCPEWTDHNVSDPGVTLIETFATMVDQLLYRLNRVPDRNYVKFLEMIGVKLFPPTPARANVTFWLSAAQEETLRIPPGTEVATTRTENEEAVLFTTTGDLDVVPSSLSRLASSIEADKIRDHTNALQGSKSVQPFDSPPKAQDLLLVGLSDATPSCAVVLRFDCEIEGVGVDPNNPPIVWEARCGDEWVRCDLERDETGGLNRSGDVILHLPSSHTAEVINRNRAGWIRCVVLEAAEGQPAYSSSPKINGLTAFTIGGTAPTINAEIVENEILGISEGSPSQRFLLRNRPVVSSEKPVVVEVSSENGWEPWVQVENFADSSREDRHFVLDHVAGEVAFGPAVRDPDGSLRQYGAVPSAGVGLRIPEYRTGGGRRGNVSRGSISVLKTSIPFVASVENRRSAGGGVDGEDLANAKSRGPILMRTRNRAVTVEDYEELAREAAPETARVKCIAAGEGAEAGSLRVLVIPRAPEDEIGKINIEDMIPSPETLEKIGHYLDDRRTLGARVSVEPAQYQGVTVVARLRARPRTNPKQLEQDALAALYRYFNPISGGPDGDGWPFGRPIHVGEVYAVFQKLRGVEFVEDARLFEANPVKGERGEATQRIDPDPHALVFSYEHQVMVEEL